MEKLETIEFIIKCDDLGNLSPIISKLRKQAKHAKCPADIYAYQFIGELIGKITRKEKTRIKVKAMENFKNYEEFKKFVLSDILEKIIEDDEENQIIYGCTDYTNRLATILLYLTKFEKIKIEWKKINEVQSE